MKDGNWIPVDKRLVNLLPKDKPYTYLEAYISFRCDMEDNKDFTINGYAKMWQWSRNKVRNFVEGLRTGKGHSVDTQRTGKGHEVRIVFNNLEEPKNTQRTGKGQSKDKQEYTTIYPNPKPNKNIYAEFVTMTEEEHAKLLAEHGEEKTKWMIDTLNNYKGSNGKKYASDYMAIRNWVVSKAEKEFKPAAQVNWRDTYLLGY